MWRNICDTYGYIVLLPEFSTDKFSTNAYQRGNVMTKDGKMNDPTKWTFEIIPRLITNYKLHRHSKDMNKLFMFGFSAGA